MQSASPTSPASGKGSSRRLRPFEDGTPPHDRTGKIFATLDAEQFQRFFAVWVAKVAGVP